MLGGMTTTIEATDQIMDFTEPQRRIAFRIHPDVFDCVPDIPVLTLLDFASLADSIDSTTLGPEMKQMFVDLFNLVLVDESAATFQARMTSKEAPISLNQVQKLMPWIMEQYGLRPTEAPSNSLDGADSQESGQNSTANAVVEELTSAESVPTAS
jgi:hypothetical protein